jgi:oligopeptide/dipeptide ABC transporter ATP-binding protein
MSISTGLPSRSAPRQQDLITATALVRHFQVGGGMFRKGTARLHAVDGVSFALAPGESLGLVGESGCGKSTLARVVARLIDADSGSLTLASGGARASDVQDILPLSARRFAADPRRADIQMVFQDATDSLNPRYSAYDTIAEPLQLLKKMSGAELQQAVTQAAADVGLPAELLPRFAHQLSGGQKARVGIARAIAVRPKLLILDEPTAALDVSVQAVVLQLLAELRRKYQLAMIFVSHDLNVVRLLCDRVLVMYLGQVVESGPAQALFEAPAHPYTRALLSAIPGRKSSLPPLQGEPKSPINPNPQQCRFTGRCPLEQPACSRTAPSLQRVGQVHGPLERKVACHFALPAPEVQATVLANHD